GMAARYRAASEAATGVARAPLGRFGLGPPLPRAAPASRAGPWLRARGPPGRLLRRAGLGSLASEPPDPVRPIRLIRLIRPIRPVPPLRPISRRQPTFPDAR